MAYAHGEQCVDHSCSKGTWRLSAPIRSLLGREIARLPNKDVSEDETRYPADAASMRAFLRTFFTRHFLQLQNSLLDYMASGGPSRTRPVDSLRILDLGSGPAIASLALMDMGERIRGTSVARPSDGVRNVNAMVNSR